jgi:hypothetical protein
VSANVQPMSVSIPNRHKPRVRHRKNSQMDEILERVDYLARMKFGYIRFTTIDGS